MAAGTKTAEVRNEEFAKDARKTAEDAKETENAPLLLHIGVARAAERFFLFFFWRSAAFFWGPLAIKSRLSVWRWDEARNEDLIAKGAPGAPKNASRTENAPLLCA